MKLKEIWNLTKNCYLPTLFVLIWFAIQKRRGKIQTGESHVHQGLSKIFVFYTYSSCFFTLQFYVVSVYIICSGKLLTCIDWLFLFFIFLRCWVVVVVALTSRDLKAVKKEGMNQLFLGLLFNMKKFRLPPPMKSDSEIACPDLRGLNYVFSVPIEKSQVYLHEVNWFQHKKVQFSNSKLNSRPKNCLLKSGLAT